MGRDQLKIFVTGSDVVIRCSKRSDAVILAPFVGEWLKKIEDHELEVLVEEAPDA